MTATISRRVLTLAVAQQLADRVTNATGYVGQIGSLHGLPGVENTPDDPPKKSAKDPRVRPYFVLFPSVGTPGAEVDLADTFVDLDWPFQITAAAGDTDDLLALIDRIDAALYRWSPGLLGTPDAVVLTGRIGHPTGYSPTLLIDRAETPWRPYSALQYQLTAHT